jgi:hypothetical protein
MNLLQQDKSGEKWTKSRETFPAPLRETGVETLGKIF